MESFAAAMHDKKRGESQKLSRYFLRDGFLPVLPNSATHSRFKLPEILWICCHPFHGYAATQHHVWNGSTISCTPKAYSSPLFQKGFTLNHSTEIIESLPTHGTYKMSGHNTLWVKYENAMLKVSISSPVRCHVTSERVDDYGNPFTRIEVHLHLPAGRSRVVMTFQAASRAALKH